MADIHPKSTKIFLEGHNDFVDIVWHDFESNLLSLLCEKDLMSASNLLLNDTSYTNELNDIDTGTVYINAKKYTSKMKTLRYLCQSYFLLIKHTQILMVDYVQNLYNLHQAYSTEKHEIIHQHGEHLDM